MAEDDPGFDRAAAHRRFATEYFNAAWELIDKKERTPAEEDEMLLRAFASALHWTRRADCTALNRSVAYWQLARVLALVGDAPLAERYASTCLEVSQNGQLPAFYLGYAYEALARAAALSGRQADAGRFLALAHDCANEVEDAEGRRLLLDDLAALA
jgi:hypothetical protein